MHWHTHNRDNITPRLVNINIILDSITACLLISLHFAAIFTSKILSAFPNRTYYVEGWMDGCLYVWVGRWFMAVACP